MSIKTYIYNVAGWISAGFNVVLTGGDDDVSISGAVGYWSVTHKDNRHVDIARKLIDSAFSPIQTNHCYNSYAKDKDESYKTINRWRIYMTIVLAALAWIPIRLFCEIYKAIGNV